jgi:hypothetical protein
MKHAGELFEGPLRQNRDNFLEAVVSSDRMGEDILILVRGGGRITAFK